MSFLTEDYSSKGLGDDGAILVGYAQKMNKKLTQVRKLYQIGLYTNNIGDEGAKAIAIGLTNNSTLTNVSFNIS